MNSSNTLNLASIQAAARRIESHVHRTAVVTCRSLDVASGSEVYLKCENFQKVGAFKARGATNAVFSLADPKEGVVTHSSGNHAQAIAYAAKLRGIPAYVVMPKTTPLVKMDAVKGYGAKIILSEPTEVAREETAKKVVADTGGVFIHPFNNYDVMAGQGTVALEWLEQSSDLDAILVPIGGGGLISGVATAMRALAPQIKIVGVEPEGASDAKQSLEKGMRMPLSSPAKSIAEGLLATVGELTFPVIRTHVDEIVSVSDIEIASAVKFLLERTKMVVETSGAVTVAALLSKRISLAGKRVGALLSGGNLDFRAYGSLIFP